MAVRLSQFPHIADSGVNPYGVEVAPGVPLAPPYVIRFRGWLTMDAVGELNFVVFNNLGVGESCSVPSSPSCEIVPPEQPIRLTIDGACSTDTFVDGLFRADDCQESVPAIPGLVPVEILIAHNGGPDNLVVRNSVSGFTDMEDADRQSSRGSLLGNSGFITARSSDFIPDRKVFRQKSGTGANLGEFLFENVPTVHQQFTSPLFQDITGVTEFADPAARSGYTRRVMTRGGATDIGPLLMQSVPAAGPPNGDFENGFTAASMFLAGDAEEISGPLFGISPFSGGSMVRLGSKHRIGFFESNEINLGLRPATSLSTFPFLVDSQATGTVSFSYRLFVNKSDVVDTKLVARLVSQNDNFSGNCCDNLSFPIEIPEADALLPAPGDSGYTHMTDWRQASLPIGANGQSNIVGTEVPVVLQILLDADFSLAFEDPDNELDPEDTEAMMAFDGVITALIDNITIQ